jgi:small-conductance mechanosensitive channel
MCRSSPFIYRYTYRTRRAPSGHDQQRSLISNASRCRATRTHSICNRDPLLDTMHTSVAHILLAVRRHFFKKKNVCFVLFYYVVSLFLRFILYIYIYYKFVLHVQRFSTDSGLYSHDVTIVYFFIVFKYCIFSGVWY